MPFSNPQFPGRVFRTVEELNAAFTDRKRIEAQLEQKEKESSSIEVKILPMEGWRLEVRVAKLEEVIQRLITQLGELKKRLLESERDVGPMTNQEGLEVGLVLRGESRGKNYTLQVVDSQEYHCSNGMIYESLSGAALGVSGNRRSGWKFWKDINGNPIGEITGRFRANALARGTR